MRHDYLFLCLFFCVLILPASCGSRCENSTSNTSVSEPAVIDCVNSQDFNITTPPEETQTVVSFFPSPIPDEMLLSDTEASLKPLDDAGTSQMPLSDDDNSEMLLTDADTFQFSGFSKSPVPADAAAVPSTSNALIPMKSEPSDSSFVRVKDYIPDIFTELKYATSDNFTGTVIYDFFEAYLRYGTVKKLSDAQALFVEKGFSLKIWDAFRPTSAQFKLWEIYPDSIYVANPYAGFSSHSRGNTVDVTLVNSDGSEVVMPTGFDDFSLKADRDYSDCSPEESEHARLLELVMRECGFRPYSGEWWHFSDETQYPVEESFYPANP